MFKSVDAVILIRCVVLFGESLTMPLTALLFTEAGEVERAVWLHGQQ